MNSTKMVFVLLLTGATLFNILFWNESVGLNLILFTVFILGALLLLNKGKQLSEYAKVTGAITLLLSAAVVIQHSMLSIIMYCISYFAVIGFVHRSELELFFYGVFQSFSNLKMVTNISDGMKEMGNSSGINTQKIFTYFKIGILPILVLVVFYFLYYFANPVFADYTNTAFTWVGNIFTIDFSFSRILFFVLGLMIIGMALWKDKFSVWVDKNNNYSEQLLRKTNEGKLFINTMGLKREYQSAIVMFLLLNILLFVVNLTDINFVWFNFVENPDYSLKTYVHQGTYILIASIMLAMSIIIYFFRGNLNFFQENNKLKILTYAWILQNGILAISLAIRNYRYIQYHGLAYKRIGVIIFLVAVLIGLITMYIKVKEKRSLYFLVNRNSWAVYLLLVVSSFVNWDVSITNYNILADTKRSLETSVLTHQLSDKNYYLLKQYNDVILEKAENGLTQYNLNLYCDHKRNRILKRRKNTSWLSWNYADYKNLKLIESVSE